jgi:hypothetical protein
LEIKDEVEQNKIYLQVAKLDEIKLKPKDANDANCNLKAIKSEDEVVLEHPCDLSFVPERHPKAMKVLAQLRVHVLIRWKYNIKT